MEIENKKILVTGAAGFIGSHLVDKLLEMGNDVVGFDNFDQYYVGKEQNIQHSVANSSYKVARADILDFEALDKTMENVNIVFHLAAQPGVRFSAENPRKTTRVNVDGTLNVLMAAKKNNVEKLVFASSSSVYGVPQYLPVDEEHPKSPISVYGVSKLAAEEYCRLYGQQYDLPVVALRYHTVFGPRQRPDMAIYKFVEAIIRGKRPVIYGDGNQTRDFTFVSDAVTGTLLACEKERSSWEVFNIGSGSQISVNDTVVTIINLTGKKEVPPIYEEPKRGDVPDTLANIEKARKRLGYKPQVQFEEGLKRFLEWFSKKEKDF